MGEAKRRREAMAKGEPDPMPEKAGLKSAGNAHNMLQVFDTKDGHVRTRGALTRFVAVASAAGASVAR